MGFYGGKEPQTSEEKLTFPIQQYFLSYLHTHNTSYLHHIDDAEHKIWENVNLCFQQQQYIGYNGKFCPVSISLDIMCKINKRVLYILYL